VGRQLGKEFWAEAGVEWVWAGSAGELLRAWSAVELRRAGSCVVADLAADDLLLHGAV
jgi:hypothetical protein